MELLSGGSAATKPPSDNESLATSLKKLEELLDKVYAYVDDVAVSDGLIADRLAMYELSIVFLLMRPPPLTAGGTGER